MIVIPVPTDDIVELKRDHKGDPTGVQMTPPWGNYFEQNTQQWQQSLSNEGFWIPSVSSASNSVTPPTSGGQLAQVAASFGQQGGVNAGTIVFDPAEVNGGSAPAPNGQLKVILADGVFHKITNT
jgi:hypothetical protein